MLALEHTSGRSDLDLERRDPRDVVVPGVDHHLSFTMPAGSAY